MRQKGILGGNMHLQKQCVCIIWKRWCIKCDFLPAAHFRVSAHFYVTVPQVPKPSPQQKRWSVSKEHSLFAVNTNWAEQDLTGDYCHSTGTSWCHLWDFQTARRVFTVLWYMDEQEFCWMRQVITWEAPGNTAGKTLAYLATRQLNQGRPKTLGAPCFSANVGVLSHTITSERKDTKHNFRDFNCSTNFNKLTKSESTENSRNFITIITLSLEWLVNKHKSNR